MENNILDQEQTSQPRMEFAGFWLRVGASIIDFLIMLPVIGLNFYNNMSIKSLVLGLILSFVYILYKLIMEGTKGATIGKRVLGITLVNENNEMINMNQAITRNIFYLINVLIGIASIVIIFNTPGFEDATTFMEISTFQQENGPAVASYFGIVILISCLWVAFDSKKQSLHDKIGKTYCVRKLD